MQTQPYPAVGAVVSDPSGTTLRDAIAYVTGQMREPAAPPAIDHRRARFLWGLAQPLLGMRVMLRDRTMLGEALVPVFAVALLCTIGAIASATANESDPIRRIGVGIVWFFATFITLAPVPPFLFARHYARMAARARGLLGLGPRDPWLEPIAVSLGKTIAQSIVIAIGLAPITIVLSLVPYAAPLVLLVQGLWTLHWMVVEGLDNGRSLAPGDSVDRVTREEAALRHDPWFHRWLDRVPPRAAKWLAPVRMIAEIVRALGSSWSPEIRIVERDHALAGGFGLGVVALLAVPGLNLFFRPALVIGAAHLRGRLEHDAGT
ncbi:MAG TPA: hypothetical protein VFG69_01815 [Nannocystaceae bacterium]|nr:hypothetical protein [Nannocystaceae bacterium]